MEIHKNGNDTVTYAVTVKPNSFSFRYAGVGSEAKIYFEDLEDLKQGINAVIEGKKYAEKLMRESAVEGEAK